MLLRYSRSSPPLPALAPLALLAGLPLSSPAQDPLLQPEVTVSAVSFSSPVSPSASSTLLAGDDLSVFHLTEPSELVRHAANFSATDSGTGSFGDVYSVRGLSNTVFFGPPAVTVYVDDVPYGGPGSFARRIPAISSVEFLRGPQPLAGGLNTYGGVINIRTHQPGNRLEGEIQTTVGSYNLTDTSGWIMGPLIKDLLSFRLGGGYERRDGYLKNPTTGERVDSMEHEGIDAGLHLTPAPGWDIRLTGAWDRHDDGAPRLTSHVRDGFYDVSSDHEGRQNRNSDQQALRIAYENAGWQFLSVTSRRHWQLSPLSMDADYTAEPLGTFGVDLDQEAWSQEFRLGNRDPGSDFQWNVGLFGSTSESTGSNLRTLNTQRRDITITPLQLSLTLPRLGTIPLPLVEIVATSDSDISATRITRYRLEEETAGFLSGGSWSGWEPFTFHAGARVEWTRRQLERDSSSTTEVDTLTRIQPVPPLVVSLPRGRRITVPVPTPDPFETHTTLRDVSPQVEIEEEWTHFTPTAGVDWKLSSQALAYVKTAHAFKPGGYSAYADDSRLLAFDPEKCWSTEGGLKTQWLDGDLAINLAGFYNEIRDYQIERGLSLVDYVVLNADRAATYGAELEAIWRAARRLDLSGSAGWTHAEFKNFTDPITGESLAGNTLPYAPKWDAVLAADFHLECGFFTRVEYLVTGPTTYDDRNRPEFEQDTFGLLNTAVGWRKGPFTLTAYATNLTGEEYYTNINTTLRTRSVGAPREYGVRLNVVF